jgi:hypothetical protein
MELKEAQLDPETLEKVGGIEGLLDKVAQENPEAILPEGIAPGMPVEEGAPPMPEAAPEAPMPEAAPEAAPEMGGEEEIGEEELDQLADALDQAGVTPEDLEQAFQDIQALQEAGVQPDELAQAIEEMGAEEEGAALGGEEEVAPEPAGEVEAPVEEPAEAPAEEEKVASEEQSRRIDMIKEFLKR